jgi:hypothetical protein
MDTFKSGTVNPKTVVLTLHSESVRDIRNNIALALLLGAYNPLRQYSTNGIPIDIERFKELQDKFDSIISEVESEMQVSILEVDKF